MFKTDAGVFREALKACKLPGHDTCRVYNDLNKKTGIRRLKIEAGFRDSYPKPIWDQFINLLKQGYGVRFRCAELVIKDTNWGYVNRYIAIKLDDNVAPAPKREPRPKPAFLKALPADKTNTELLEFWQRVLKPTKRKGLDHKKLHNGFLGTTVEDIIVYKKVYTKAGASHVLCTLRIPKGTRVHVTYGKCRASKAEVVSLVMARSGNPLNVAYSRYNSFFRYIPGDTVKPGYPFANHIGECASGIHFFVNPTKALMY